MPYSLPTTPPPPPTSSCVVPATTPASPGSHFPVGFGGLGLRPDLNRHIDNRFREAGAAAADPTTFFMALAGPTIVTHGGDEQKQRFLRPMFTGEEKWCQLFSEPGAGSDFAGLADQGDPRRRRVDRQRPEGLEHARSPRPTGACSSPAATPTSPKHKGMTYFCARMDDPRCRRAPPAPDHRRGRVQRGLHDRRAHPRQPTHRRESAKAGGRDRDPNNERVAIGGGGAAEVNRAAVEPPTMLSRCGRRSTSPSGPAPARTS